MSRIITTLLFAIMAVGFCFNLYAETDTKEMSEDDFVDLYVQLSLAAEKHLSNPDTLKAVQDKIFEDSEFTREEFNAFQEKINNNTEQWNEIWQKIVDKLSKITSEENQKENKEKTTSENK